MVKNGKRLKKNLVKFSGNGSQVCFTSYTGTSFRPSQATSHAALELSPSLSPLPFHNTYAVIVVQSLTDGKSLNRQLLLSPFSFLNL
jgi:hypothetical protein